MSEEIRVERAIRLIEKLYEGGFRDPVLLLGSIGIGKTESVEEMAKRLAEKMGREFKRYERGITIDPEKDFIYVEINAEHIEPSDLQGFPRQEGRIIEYVPLGYIDALRQCPGVLFIDEITNIERKDVRGATLKLVLEKKSGFTVLHKDVLIVSAGNSMEDSSLASEFSEPELNRWFIFKVKNTVEDWYDYMMRKYGDAWDKRVYAFLVAYKQYFSMKPKVENKVNFDNFATPRKWTKVAVMMFRVQMEQNELEVFLESAVGKEASRMFLSFISVQVPKLEDIDEKVWNDLNMDQRYMASVKIAELLKEEVEKGKFSDLALRLLGILRGDRETLSAVCMMLGGKRVAKMVQILGMNHSVTKAIMSLQKLLREG